MAKTGGNGYGGSFDTVLGQIPSSVWDGSMVNIQPQGPALAGSPGGVPPVDEVSGAGGGPAASISFGQAVGSQSAHKQPVFWLFVLMVVGVLILGHVARLSTRE